VGNLRIEEATILTQAGAQLIEKGTLVARDGLITYVGPAATAPAGTEGEQLINAAGRLLMPGLVNAHTHLAMTVFRGYADDMPLKPWLEDKIWPVERQLKHDDVYWGALLGVVEMLRGGVTCFADMYHFTEAVVEAAWEGGIRAAPSGVLLGFWDDAAERLQQLVEYCLQLRAEKSRRIHPMLGPHAPYTCNDQLLGEVAAAAREHDLGLHIHLAETAGEVTESLQLRRVTPVRHLLELGLLAGQITAAHCVHLTDEDIALLAEHQVGVAHCPGSNMKLGSGFAPTAELLAAGAVVGLGTDGAASNNNLDLMEEMRLAALFPKGISSDPTVVPATAALRMATLGGAQALGLGQLIGSLEPGKRADCIIVDLSGAHNQPLFDVESQLVYAARSSDVDSVIVEGEVLLHDGKFTQLDEAEIIHQAAAVAHALADQ
jgi:5-methylthioadenosine/S-adenosylhomocysteine deaminase